MMTLSWQRGRLRGDVTLEMVWIDETLSDDCGCDNSKGDFKTCVCSGILETKGQVTYAFFRSAKSGKMISFPKVLEKWESFKTACLLSLFAQLRKSSQKPKNVSLHLHRFVVFYPHSYYDKGTCQNECSVVNIFRKRENSICCIYRCRIGLM